MKQLLPNTQQPESPNFSHVSLPNVARRAAPDAAHRADQESWMSRPRTLRPSSMSR